MLQPTTPRAASVHIAMAPAAAPIVSAAAAVRLNGSRLTAACPSLRRDPLSSLLHRSAAARSAALCQRSSGSLARHFLTTRSRLAGTPPRSDDSGCGSWVRMAAMRLARLRPSNGGAARGHLVENHPQREDVRACIRVAPLDLLRRHIRDRAEHRALLGQFEALRGSRRRSPRVRCPAVLRARNREASLRRRRA